MKFKSRLILFVALVFSVLLVSASFAGAKDFQKDLSVLRKGVIPMCSQLQNPGQITDNAQLLAKIDLIIAGWKEISEAYKNNPPAEYAKDPSWPGYFNEVLDNFEIMRAKTAKKEYKRAMQFCGLNCGIFVNIDQVNGIRKLSDQLFMLRKNVKLMREMSLAGNWPGAKRLGKNNEEIFEAMFLEASAEGPDTKQELKPLQSGYQMFAENIKKNNAVAVEQSFKIFMKRFNGLYVKRV